METQIATQKKSQNPKTKSFRAIAIKEREMNTSNTTTKNC